MGIKGLLPLLKSIQQPICLSELSGSAIGVDAYCWLHKGAYACALELAEGNDSNLYVNYVMKRVNMMLYYKVKPILVFDGGYLPSKSEKEAERRQRRKENKSQGLAHLKNGNKSEAVECFQKSIDITPEMALNVMKVCRERGVDVIVAPYEADAQLAYLMKTGITQYTITEDSDLLVYGCEKVIFKMDANGSGLMIDLQQLPKVKCLRMDGFTPQKFREMCILGGCDYLQSIKGMGLMTAHKLIRNHSTIKKLLSTLRLNAKMRVPMDYEARFEKAEQTFLYQIVFDPNSNKLVPLNPLPDDLDPVHLFFAGHGLKWKQEDALDLAMGNLNPLTGQRIGDFHLTQVLSFDEDEDHESSKKGKKSSKNPICPQMKKFRSILSTKKTYEAEKNLNGAFRETKSSENANRQFVPPARSKRAREGTDADKYENESSKFARAYSASTTELTVDEGFESTYKAETKSVPQLQSITRSTSQPQLKKKRCNPFRCPVIRKQQDNPVVSRYFGLAAMERTKTELPQNDDMAQTNHENTFSQPQTNTCDETEVPADSQISTSSREEAPGSSDQADNEFRESDCFSGNQPSENSPPDNSMDPVLPTHSPTHATNSLAPLSNSPPLPTFPFNSPPLSAGSLTKFPPLPKLRTMSTSRKSTKQKASRNRTISNQMSLDKFAYTKDLEAVTDEIKPEPAITSSKRTVLADCSPPNYKPDETFNQRQDEKMNSKKENYGDVLKDDENRQKDISCLTRDVNADYSDATLVWPKSTTIGLRTKPTTGLGRCRAVGLSRPKKNTKENKANHSRTIFLDYFAHGGRDKT